MVSYKALNTIIKAKFAIKKNRTTIQIISKKFTL